MSDDLYRGRKQAAQMWGHEQASLLVGQEIWVGEQLAGYVDSAVQVSNRNGFPTGQFEVFTRPPSGLALSSLLIHVKGLPYRD